MNSVRPAAQVVHDMVVEYLETAARLSPSVEA
jgi:hypothetical protein